MTTRSSSPNRRERDRRQIASPLHRTTMSNPHLPAEILDHIVDFLWKSKHALRNCCLVSKSWVPRARSHLFTDISFRTKKDLELWMGVFPDPYTSPASYTKTLSVGCVDVVTAADMKVGGWLRGFSRVVSLRVSGPGTYPFDPFGVSFIPFHGFSPIKSLHVDPSVLLSSHLFDLALSFPLLEDLNMSACFGSVSDGSGFHGPQIVIQPSKSPMCTGSLVLSLEAIEPFAPRLLSLSGGIHFRELTLTWRSDEQFLLATELVEECSDTLEHLDMSFTHHRASI